MFPQGAVWTVDDLEYHKKRNPKGNNQWTRWALLYLADERYVDVARSVLYVYSRPSGPCQAMPHPMGQIMTIKSRPPSVVLFHAFHALPYFSRVILWLLHCTVHREREGLPQTISISTWALYYPRINIPNVIWRSIQSLLRIVKRYENARSWTNTKCVQEISSLQQSSIEMDSIINDLCSAALSISIFCPTRDVAGLVAWTPN